MINLSFFSIINSISSLACEIVWKRKLSCFVLLLSVFQGFLVNAQDDDDSPPIGSEYTFDRGHFEIDIFNVYKEGEETFSHSTTCLLGENLAIKGYDIISTVDTTRRIRILEAENYSTLDLYPDEKTMEFSYAYATQGTVEEQEDMFGYEAQVMETKETKVINGYKATKWTVSYKDNDLSCKHYAEVWLTKDIGEVKDGSLLFFEASTLYTYFSEKFKDEWFPVEITTYKECEGISKSVRVARLKKIDLKSTQTIKTIDYKLR